MEIPWPLNTSFRITSREGVEIWSVSTKSDPKHGIIGEETSLGKSLLFSGSKRLRAFPFPDNSKFIYKIIGIKPPGAEENSFNTPLDYYLESYRSDPHGMRHNPYMKDICLNCGHQNPPTIEDIKYCEVCNTRWYRDHCWNCKNKYLDSRDPDTPRCSRCRYWICAKCRNCFCDSGFIWVESF